MNRSTIRSLPYLLAFFTSLCIMILELVASRLVARHVGASLSVWTSVIGIMLGGICLGNVLGGRLADRIDPARALGPLYALGSALTLGSLWMNGVVGYIPGLGYLPLGLQTIVVVSLDFLVPGTVLGMIGPVVAKMAVEQAKRSGGALGDVYFMGAVGSIVGTFVAGFVLMYYAPTSTIVILVSASLALLSSSLIGSAAGVGLGLATAAVLVAGAVLTMLGITGQEFVFGSLRLNVPLILGSGLAVALAWAGVKQLRQAKAETDAGPIETQAMALPQIQSISLTDLSTLAFVSSLAFMTLEMVAGRLVTRNLGSSIYGWTSVIGVLLGGLSLGNWLGGRIANRTTHEGSLATLFLIASILTSGIILAETPRPWMVRNPIEYFFQGGAPMPLVGDTGPFLTQVSGMIGWSWPVRVLFWVSVEFLLPAIAMGTFGPVIAKLAVERVRTQTKGTGQAIGQVYAWGMVGSILGTFLTGFLLIDVFGTKGLILILATVLAITATMLGRVWHAAWAGIPLGLCVIAFGPALLPAKSSNSAVQKARTFLVNQGQIWGLREVPGDPSTTENKIAYVDESNYFYIKVSNQALDDTQKRTLVLDNLIHGYFLKDHPERLDYDYEHIYAHVAHRVMQAKARSSKAGKAEDQPLNTLFLGGGSYTFPRYLQKIYPKTQADVAEIDPAVTEANHLALWLPRDTTIKTTWGDARQFVANRRGEKYDLIFGDAFNDFSVPWHLTTKEFNDKLNGLLTDDGVYMINIIDKYTAERKLVFKSLYRAEVEAVTDALSAAGAVDAEALAKSIVLGLDKKDLGADLTKLSEATMKSAERVTTLVSPSALRKVIAADLQKSPVATRGDTQALVNEVRTILQGNDKAKSLPGRIDAWAEAAVKADTRYATDPDVVAGVAAGSIAVARESGSFLGSWVATARKSFGEHVYVFGTASEPGAGTRETFVIVASRKPLDLDELGLRDDDPHFFNKDNTPVHSKAYNQANMDAIKLRSRGIILTDDYAPVENLLAPVARTRADDE